MSDAKSPSPTEAILVMDSRTNTLAVRSQKITGAWSKLFKLGDHYLDLSLKSVDARATLMGKVVSPAGIPKGSVALIDEAGEALGQAQLSISGMFNLFVEQAGLYNLEMAIGQQRYVIRPVDVH